jgi:hypothetical protein
MGLLSRLHWGFLVGSVPPCRSFFRTTTKLVISKLDRSYNDRLLSERLFYFEDIGSFRLQYVPGKTLRGSVNTCDMSPGTYLCIYPSLLLSVQINILAAPNTRKTWRRLRSATNSTRMMTQSLVYVCNTSGGRVRETGDVFLAVLPGLDRKIARLGSPILQIPSDPFRCRGSATKTTCNKMLMKDGQEIYWRVGTIRSTW